MMRCTRINAVVSIQVDVNVNQ